MKDLEKIKEFVTENKYFCFIVKNKEIKRVYKGNDKNEYIRKLNNKLSNLKPNKTNNNAIGLVVTVKYYSERKIREDKSIGGPIEFIISFHNIIDGRLKLYSDKIFKNSNIWLTKDDILEKGFTISTIKNLAFALLNQNITLHPFTKQFYTLLMKN